MSEHVKQTRLEGWINDENPLPTARRIAAEHGFQTPIDEIDAAARLLDPVVMGTLACNNDVSRGDGKTPYLVGSLT